MLSDPLDDVLPLRSSSDSKPFDLLTDDGTASGRLPAAVAMHDYRVQKDIQRMGFLCLAFSMWDLLALRAAGVPVVPAKGLEQISPETLKELRSSPLLTSAAMPLDTDGPSAKAPPVADPPLPDVHYGEHSVHEPSASTEELDAPPPPTPPLFLVGWSPAKMSRLRPEKVDAVSDSLTRVRDNLEIEFNGAFVWRPTQGQFERIKYCLANAERKDLQKAIVTSLRSSVQPLGQPGNDGSVSGSFREVRARFQEALSRPSMSPAERRRRLHHYQQAVEQALVAPVIEQAKREVDPKRRSRLAGLARINQMLYPAVELHLATYEKEVAKRGVRAQHELSDVRDLMKMFDLLYKFTQDDE